MSVYTTLTLKEVQDFAAPYGLKAIDLIPIQGGIQNTNYFLVCEDQQYVLTVFEDMDEQAAGELVPVLEHLGQAGLAVPVPLSHSGKAIHSIKDKPAQIAPRLMGEHPMPSTIGQVEAIAVAQAKMHVALQDFKLQRNFVRDHAYWLAVSQEIKPSLSPADKVLLGKLLGLYEALTAVYPDRPRGFIHSDLFRDNTLFEGDQLNGILDFYELNQDEFLFANAFLKAYETVRPLTEDEKSCLELYLAMAAGRFWMMRLQVAQRNAALGRNGEDILQKNPDEMRNMLIERLKFVTA